MSEAGKSSAIVSGLGVAARLAAGFNAPVGGTDEDFKAHARRKRLAMDIEAREESHTKYIVDMGGKGAEDLGSLSLSKAKSWANVLTGTLTQEGHPAVSEMLDFFRVDTSEDLMRLPLEQRMEGYATYVRAHRTQQVERIKEGGIPGAVSKYMDATKTAPTLFKAEFEVSGKKISATVSSPSKTIKQENQIEVDDLGNVHIIGANPVGVGHNLYAAAVTSLERGDGSPEEIKAASRLVEQGGVGWEVVDKELSGLGNKIDSMLDNDRKTRFRSKGATMLAGHASSMAIATFGAVSAMSDPITSELYNWSANPAALSAARKAEKGKTSPFVNQGVLINSQHLSILGEIEDAKQEFITRAGKHADTVGGVTRIKEIADLYFDQLYADEDKRHKGITDLYASLEEADPEKISAAKMKLSAETAESELKQQKARQEIIMRGVLSDEMLQRIGTEKYMSAAARSNMAIRYASRSGTSIEQATNIGALSGSIENHIKGGGKVLGEAVDRNLHRINTSAFKNIANKYNSIATVAEKDRPEVVANLKRQYARLENIVRVNAEYFENTENPYRKFFAKNVSILRKKLMDTKLFTEAGLEKSIEEDLIAQRTSPVKTFKFLKSDLKSIEELYESLSQSEKENMEKQIRDSR